MYNRNNMNMTREMTEIKTLIDMAQLIKGERKRGTLVKYHNELIERIGKLPISNVIDLDLLDKLFFDLDRMSEISESDFLLLQSYCNRIMLDKCIPSKYFNLYLLLLSRENMETLDIHLRDTDPERYIENLTSFLQVIFDLYIPSEDPLAIIKKLYEEVGPSLVEICKLPNYFIINEIYNRNDYKYEAIQSYLVYNNITLDFLNKVYEISNRFSRYWESIDTVDFIHDMLVTMKDGDEINSLIQMMLQKIEESYVIDEKIFHLLLLEIIELSSDMIDLYHYNDYKEIIEKKLYLKPDDEDETNDVLTESSFFYTKDDGLEYAIEAYKKNSKPMHKAQHNIYKAFKNYKNAEDKVDSQVTKMIEAIKKMMLGDIRTEIIEGKDYTVIGILKKALGSAAVFSFGPIKGLIAMIVRYTLRKNIYISERQKIIMELEAELELLDEKIDDARGEGNREAKYALMRTRTEVVNAIRKIKLGLEADRKSLDTAKKIVTKKK